MRFFTLLLNEVPSEGGAKCDPRSTWLTEKALTALTNRNRLQHTNRMPRNRLPTENTRELQTNRQKKPRETIRGTSRRLKPERVKVAQLHVS